MPIVHFVNSKNQTTGGMKSVLNYVIQERKTAHEDRKFVSGVNCSPQSVYTEMMMTKRLYKKNSGRLYYHLVQSFPKGYEISPELAHNIAVEFAEKVFEKYECVVATHIDREHIHSHFVFNSVSFEDGRKYHSDLDSVKRLMKLSDEICLKYGVSTLDSPDDKFGQKKSDTLSDREYRSADKGESWKFQLIAAITECMKGAKSKKQFAYLMRNRYGYGVRWEDNRKHITYTNPNGYRCRDKRLHDEKFLKEAMEREFEIRYGLLNGEKQTSASAGGTARHDDGDNRTTLVGGGRSADGRSPIAGQNNKSDERDDHSRADEYVPQQSDYAVGAEQIGVSGDTESDIGKYLEGDAGTVITGWEDERGILLAAERARRMAQELQKQNVQDHSHIAVGAADIVGSVGAVASIIDDEPIDDEDVYRGSDSKQLAEERAKKESLGMKM